MKEKTMDVTTPTPVSTTAGTRRWRPLESVAGNWPIGVKIVAALIVIGAPVAQVIDGSLFDMSNGYVSLFHALSTDPGSVYAGSLAGMFAPALTIGAVLIWFQLGRSRSRIAASISLVTGVLAFTCLALTTGYSYAALGLSHAHLGTAAVADALSSYDGLPAPVLFATFTITSTVSILAASWALWRSHAVSRAGVILLALFIIIDMVGILPVNPHYIGLAAAVLIAVSIFRAVPLRTGIAATNVEP